LSVAEAVGHELVAFRRAYAAPGATTGIGADTTGIEPLDDAPFECLLFCSGPRKATAIFSNGGAFIEVSVPVSCRPRMPLVPLSQGRWGDNIASVEV
jgi:hypothetical protein